MCGMVVGFSLSGASSDGKSGERVESWQERGSS